MKYVAFVRCKQMSVRFISWQTNGRWKSAIFVFFVLRSSASNGGPIHMARTSGSVHMERSTVGHAPVVSLL